MKNGFVKVALITPKITVADPNANIAEMTRLLKEAERENATVAVFPELCVTGYTCRDLFCSETLLRSAKDAVERYANATAESDTLSLIGAPLIWKNKLYNCAVVCQRGKVLGAIPKSHIPNYAEFYELRQFTTAPKDDGNATIHLCGEDVPFGTNLLFACRELPALKIAAEICEDLWVTAPPSDRHTAAGATVICNLSASNETIGKAEYRRALVSMQSARTCSAYLYCSCGEGESTTDIVFSGHNLICENGSVLAETLPFDTSKPILYSEVDVERLARERRRMNTYDTSLVEAYREIPFSFPLTETYLTRYIDPHPFVPADKNERSKRCETILNIQSQGLKQRVSRAYAKKLVIGISGGLDSTLALLVAVRTMDALHRPRTDIVAVTMPCFGTTKRTKNNATVLCEELGVDFRCIDIKQTVDLHFADIGHDPAVQDVTYENCQARERTQVLMDIANACSGMVIGTGDLSELALGWATYNGDHMSMYGVNASVPKTLVRHIVTYYADKCEAENNTKLADALRDVLDTPVSPELLPAAENGEISQKTEDLVGPYELHDFYLYHMIRFGFSPDKLYCLAMQAFAGTYSEETILKWLETFLRRFFAQQFKRSCLPDGPKVGSISLSPRGDWRMPSDASAAAWLAEVEKLKQQR